MTTSKTLVMMVETTTQNKAAAQKVSYILTHATSIELSVKVADSIVSLVALAAEQDKNWFVNFILITFDSK